MTVGSGHHVADDGAVVAVAAVVVGVAVEGIVGHEVLGGRDGAALDKVGHQGHIPRDGEGVGVLHRHHLAALVCPVLEGVAAVGCGGEGAGCSTIVTACAAHRAALRRVARGGNGNKGVVHADSANRQAFDAAGAVHAEAQIEGEVIRAARVVSVERTRPVVAVATCEVELIAPTVAGGGQEETRAIGSSEEATAHSVLGGPGMGGVVNQFLPFFLGSHAPLRAPIGRGRIVLGKKHGQVIGETVITIVRIVTILGQSILAAHTVLVVFPIIDLLRLRLAPGKVVAVAFGGASPQVAGSPKRAAGQAEVNIFACARNAKAGHEGSVAFHGKAIGGCRGDPCAVLVPTDEGVARVGRGRQGAGLACLISAAAAHGAALGGVGRDGDGVGGRCALESEHIRVGRRAEGGVSHKGDEVVAAEVRLLACGVVVEAERQLVAVVAEQGEEEHVAVERLDVHGHLAATALVAAEGPDLKVGGRLLLAVDADDTNHRRRVGVLAVVGRPVIGTGTEAERHHHCNQDNLFHLIGFLLIII